MTDSKTLRASVHMPGPGDVLAGKYLVERVLGRGGMGLVLAARHSSLQQSVAIKVLLPEALGSAESLARFTREARAVAGIQSEHVAHVRDFGTLEDSAPYLVMEFLDGTDLKRHIEERGPLSAEDAVDYVLQACEALCEAHRAGIVHRDLKPANLFLTRYPDGLPLVKVLDFGISKAERVDTREGALTRTDTVLGSPLYMSPEQIRSPRDVDQRTDIWSLGAVLFELVTGKPPFDGDNVPMLSARIVLEPPASMQELRPGIPAGLEAVVMRCLEKEAAARYGSVPELAAALEPFASPRARLSLDRIARLAVEAESLGATEYVPTLRDPPARPETTAGPVSMEHARPVARRAAWLVGGLLVAGAVGSWALLRASHGGPIATAPASAAARTSASTSSPPAPPPVAASRAPSGAAVGSAPSAAASAPARAPGIRPAASASARPRAPARVAPRAKPRRTCRGGERLSHGHCCAAGLVWQDGRCSRPLATKL